MTITFLGTGTSTGVPQLGCSCGTCTSPDPRDRRMRTSALVTADNGTRLLTDCGPDFRTQMLAYARDVRPDALLVTHTHYDHVGGLDDIRPYCTPQPFDVYCSAADADTIMRRMPYCFGDNPYPGSPRMTLHRVSPGLPIVIGGVTVLPLAVRHGTLDITGYRIGPLTYITDASYLPTETLDAIHGTDTLVINALRHDQHPSHMNLKEALDVISVTAPRAAYLIHLAHQMGRHADVESTLPPGVHIACDGLTVTVPASDSHA